MSILETVFSSTCFLGESENGLVISDHLDSSPVQKNRRSEKIKLSWNCDKKDSSSNKSMTTKPSIKTFQLQEPSFSTREVYTETAYVHEFHLLQ